MKKLNLSKKILLICLSLFIAAGGITGFTLHVNASKDNTGKDTNVDNTAPSAGFGLSKKKKVDVAVLYGSSNGSDSDIASKVQANITNKLNDSGVDAQVQMKNIAKNDAGEYEFICYWGSYAYIKNDGTLWINSTQESLPGKAKHILVFSSGICIVQLEDGSIYGQGDYLSYYDSSFSGQSGLDDNFYKLSEPYASRYRDKKKLISDLYGSVYALDYSENLVFIDRATGNVSTIYSNITKVIDVGDMSTYSIRGNSTQASEVIEALSSDGHIVVIGDKWLPSTKKVGLVNVYIGNFGATDISYRQGDVKQGHYVHDTDDNLNPFVTYNYGREDVVNTFYFIKDNKIYFFGANTNGGMYDSVIQYGQVNDNLASTCYSTTPVQYSLGPLTSLDALSNHTITDATNFFTSNFVGYNKLDGTSGFISYNSFDDTPYNQSWNTPMHVLEQYIHLNKSQYYMGFVQSGLYCGGFFDNGNGLDLYTVSTRDVKYLPSTGVYYSSQEIYWEYTLTKSSTLGDIKTNQNTVKDTNALDEITWRDNSTHFIINLSDSIFDNNNQPKDMKFNGTERTATISIDELLSYKYFKVIDLDSPNNSSDAGFFTIWQPANKQYTMCVLRTDYVDLTKMLPISILNNDVSIAENSAGQLLGLDCIGISRNQNGTLSNVNNVELLLYKDTSNQVITPEELAKLESQQTYFIGASTSDYKDKVNSIIQELDGRGTYIQHNTVDSDLQQSESYIMSILNQQQDNSNIFLVGDEVNYNETYKDSNNDKENDELWSYSQDNKHLNYDNQYVSCSKTGDIPLDNDLGISDFATSAWMHNKVTVFDKPGKYKIGLKVQDNPTASDDNPSGDSNFSNYNDWSDDNYITINVHRKPIADFKAYATANTSTGKFDITQDDGEESYDPDHSISYSDKGIKDKKFQWKEVTDGVTDIWHDGKLPSPQAPNKDFMVKLEVQDMEGQWSDPTVKYVSSKNENIAPIAKFIENEAQMPVDQLNGDAAPSGDYANDRSDVEFTDQSYDPNNDSIEEQWTVTDNNGNTIYNGSTMPTAATFYGKPLGTYTISLTCDDGPNPKVGVPMTSQPYTQQLTLVPINHMPVAHFEVDNPTGEPENIKITEDSTDPDNDPIDTRDWTVTDSSGNVVQETQNQLPDFTQLDGTYTLTLKVKDNPKVPPELWSKPYSQQITIESLKITGSLYPNPAKQGQEITLDITTHGKAKYLRAYFPTDITSRDKRGTSFPIQKQIIEEDVHNEKIPYILPLDTPLTLDSNGNRLRAPYSIIVEAEKASGVKKSITLYLDVQGNVLDGVKSVNIDDDDSN